MDTNRLEGVVGGGLELKILLRYPDLCPMNARLTIIGSDVLRRSE